VICWLFVHFVNAINAHKMKHIKIHFLDSLPHIYVKKFFYNMSTIKITKTY